MPYETIHDLPPRVRHVLPEHAQEIYLAAFNNAWSQYADRYDREEVAHRVAWSAVKKVYEKGSDGDWVRRRNLYETKRRVTLYFSAFLRALDPAALLQDFFKIVGG